jgi:hypothetical protein
MRGQHVTAMDDACFDWLQSRVASDAHALAQYVCVEMLRFCDMTGRKYGSEAASLGGRCQPTLARCKPTHE